MNQQNKEILQFINRKITKDINRAEDGIVRVIVDFGANQGIYDIDMRSGIAELSHSGRPVNAIVRTSDSFVEGLMGGSDHDLLTHDSVVFKGDEKLIAQLLASLEAT